MRKLTTRRPSRNSSPRQRFRRGTVLPAILVAIAILALAGYRYADLMTSEYIAAVKTNNGARVKYLADSGAHYAAALLADPLTMQALNNNPFDNDAYFHDKFVLAGGEDPPGKKGYFSLVAPVDPLDPNANGQAYRFGVLDEMGKINLNALFKLDKTGQYGYNVLMLLPNMTDDTANSILFWLDPTATARSSGAGADYYTSLTPAYYPRNGPLDTLEELLCVKGVTPQFFYGGDKNHNGVLDLDEIDDGTGNPLGWASYLTIYGREQNLDSEGNTRIYLNDGDLTTLQTKLTSAVGPDLANFIIAYRTYGAAANAPPVKSTGKDFSGQAPLTGGVNNGPLGNGQNTGATKTSGTTVTPPTTGGATGGATGATGGTQAKMGTTISSGAAGGGKSGGGKSGGGGSNNIASLFDLIGIYVSIPSDQPNGQPTLYPSPLNDNGALAQLLPILLDKTTTSKGTELSPRLNINTAPQAVLLTLPYLGPDDVQTIVQQRPSSANGNLTQPEYQTITWLITQAGYKPSAVKQIEKYITARTQVYRVQALGYLDGGTGPTARVEAVVDANNGRPRILYYRDLTELGKGFDLSTNGAPSTPAP